MSTHQTCSKILMVRPANFGYNPETAENNVFQNEMDITRSTASQRALAEFEKLAGLLSPNIDIVIVNDTEEPRKPDAVFPNNWISTHQGKRMITYPMFSPLRRNERREDIIERLQNELGYERRYSLEYYEEQGLFLEGTGSMVLDRINNICYAGLSDRTNPLILDKFCTLMGYRLIMFHAVDEENQPIYHTNVMMNLGKDFCVVTADTIVDSEQRKQVISNLEASGREIIYISRDQMKGFAANIIELQSKQGGSMIAMSDSAFHSFTPEQIAQLKQHGKIIYSAIPTIETLGGGSVRCMIAELF